MKNPGGMALEIHDAGLLAVPSDAAPEPGYALLDGKTLVTGRAAFEYARLRPRFAHHRFWHDLDVVPLARPFRSLSAADVAHAQLAELWERVGAGVESVILALSGAFSERQLALALGIARACGIPVEGMVDAALAAAADVPARQMLHLDVHLNRLVVSELRRTADGLARGRLAVDDGTGLVAARDALARRFAELFVRATRFDPLHAAASEQELFERLDEWLARLDREESAEIVFAERAIEVTRADLESATAVLRDRARELIRSLTRPGERVTLLVTPRLAALPGVRAAFGQATVLAAEAAAAGALRVRDAVLAPGAEALPFVTRLPADVLPAVAEAPRPRPSPGRVPTHLVRDGLAYPLEEKPILAAAPWGADGDTAPSCRIFVDGGAAVAEVEGAPGVRLNGEEVDGRVELAAGDRLCLGRGDARPLELQLIAVVE